MKRIISLLTCLLLVICCAGCKSGPAPEGNIDVDLTKLSSTMVYSEVYAMVNTPEKYMGKTVKMQGNFSVYSDKATGKNYFAAIIADATACCSQGIEFVWKGEHKYPDDYPEKGTPVTVVGKFDTYTEGEYQYTRLLDAEVEF